jgi:hypothetical protein
MTNNSKSGGMRDGQPKPSVDDAPDGLPKPLQGLDDPSTLSAAAAAFNDQPKASTGGDR